MQCKCLCVSILILVGYASAATWIKKLPQKPKEFAHLEGCFVEEMNMVIPYGEEVMPIGMCLRISCGRRYIDYASCGVADPGPNCHTTEENLTRPYPECCYSVKCDDNHI